MIRLPPRSTRTDTLFPYTTLVRSVQSPAGDCLGHPLLEESHVSFQKTLRPRLRWPVRAAAAGDFLRRRLPAELPAAARLAFAPAGQPGRAPCLRLLRSEARRVGKECVSAFRSLLLPYL